MKNAEKIFITFKDGGVHQYAIGDPFVYSDEIVDEIMYDEKKCEMQFRGFANENQGSMVFEVGKNLEGGTDGDDVVVKISEEDTINQKVESDDKNIEDVVNQMKNQTEDETPPADKILPLIKSADVVFSYSVDGNMTELDTKDVNDFINDHYVLLNDKELFKKWGIEPHHQHGEDGKMLDIQDDQFDENGNYDEFRAVQVSYYFDTIDGGTVAVDFWDVYDDNVGTVEVTQDSPQAQEVDKILSDDNWGTDIESLYEKASGKVVQSCMNQAECLKKKKEEKARKDDMLYPKETKDQEINDYTRVKSADKKVSEWGTVNKVIELLKQYKEMDERSGKDTTKQQARIYENLKALGYTGEQSNLISEADYWGMCDVINPTFEISNHDRSSWMYILTNSEDVARDYKALFDVEQYGGWEGDRKDYINDLIDSERLDRFKITPRQVWTWAKENNILEKDYNKVLGLYADAHKEELDKLIDDEKFNDWINDWLSMSYSDIDANYGKIGEGKEGIFIDAYGSNNMPSTASRFGENQEVIKGIPMGGRAYIVEGDGWAKRLYYNMKSI